MSNRTASRILLIVDESAARDVLRGTLVDFSMRAQRVVALNETGDYEGAWKLEIDSAEQGAQGVAMVRQAIWDHRPYGLVLVDLQGAAVAESVQTVRQLAEIDPELGLLAVKRAPLEDDLALHTQTFKRLVFVSQPFDQGELWQLVTAQLDRRHTREGLRRAKLELETTRRVLERMREEVEEAEQVKRQLLANISHEVRTPMNAILGFTRLLMKEPLTPEQSERLRYVYDAGNSLMRLIEGVLDFSKLSAGKLHLDRSAFELKSTVRMVLDSVQTSAADKGLALLCHIDPATPLCLRGDAGRFREVLSSLVGNAVKFTERGTVQVRIAADEDGESATTLRVVVTDTGVGIPLDRQAQVFRSFSQGDGSATREFGGIGLGLALAKRLLELMGGQIGFRSTPGQGTTFWFTVPFEKDLTCKDEPAALPPAEPAPAAARYTPINRAQDGNVRQFRILVADDDRLDRLLLEALLGRTGAVVDLVGNGHEALTVLKTNSYDLVFMDVEMPEMDGLTAIRRIREAEADGPHHLVIVALTAYTERDRETCLAAGADEYVAKPFSADALLGALERWLPGLLEASREEQEPQADAAIHSWLECMGNLRRALLLPDFRELDAQAQLAKRLASSSGAGAAADCAMRIQLAARRGDLERANAAVEQLDRAVNRFPGDVRRDATRVAIASE